jgi:hypothetical protein
LRASLRATTMRGPLAAMLRMRTVLLLFLFAVVACSGKPDAARPSPIADDADCNLSTPLVPGIPGSPGHLIPSARNPNGDSELSALMRQFVDDLRDVQPTLAAGQPMRKLYPTQRRMRCAWPTRPEERNQRFDTLAQGYLAMVRAFDAAPGKATYNGIIQGCINCHSQSCGGPLEFIDGMKWK